MSAEGKVSIILHVDDSKVRAAAVASERPLLAQKFFGGMRVDTVTTLVAAVYRLCGRAQAFASSQALEQALDLNPSPSTCLLREQLVHMETLREHLWRVFLDWPGLIGEISGSALMKQVLQMDKEWKESIDDKGQAFLLQAEIRPMQDKRDKVALEYGTFLMKHVFAMPANDFLKINNAEDFLHWSRAEKTGAAQLIQWMMDHHWAGLGQSGESDLPEIEPEWLETRLAAHDAEQFMFVPDLDGKPCETTPLSRQKKDPLIQSLLKLYGNGLLTRFTAVLIEIAAVYMTMEKASERTTALRMVKKQSSANTGVGIVEAARGRLIHRVIVQNNQVSTYQIVAPTEWNFHPQGSLKQALTGLDVINQSTLKEQARCMIHAMDPCVQFSLAINAHA